MSAMKMNQHGAVLLTVLVITMILTVVVISVMSVSVSQVKSSQQVIDDVKAEYLAEAYFYKYHQEKISSGASALPNPESVALDSKTFTITGAETPSTAGSPNPNDTTRIDLETAF